MKHFDENKITIRNCCKPYSRTNNHNAQKKNPNKNKVLNLTNKRIEKKLTRKIIFAWLFISFDR